MFRLQLPFLALALAVSPASAATLSVHPTATPPVIDGVIDPAEWNGAARSDAFLQIYPGEGAPPTERTEFWFTYDRDNLYIAVRCHDSAGRAGIRAKSMQRDLFNGADDIVQIVFDTFHRQSDGYYFGLTAAGGPIDGLVQNKSEYNNQWDALWHGHVSHDDGGWSAEFAIPVKSLAFDPNNTAWGFEVERTIRRKQETVRWANHIRARRAYSLPDLGELQGITGLQQGRGLDIKPSASITSRSNPAPGQKEFEFKPSLDVVWQVRPTLAATLTLNTDFADAEVDERQVNLTRFPLFFPEKRSFFNQDASLFTFAGLEEDPLPFFSRRIGRAPNGTPVDIIAGAKLTGRAGPWTLGILDVQTDDSLTTPGGNLFVSRIAREVLDESSVGLVVTEGDPRTDGHGHLIGTDFNYTNSEFNGGKTLRIMSGLQYSSSDFAGGDGTAATVKIDYPNEPLTVFATLRRISEAFDPPLGFVSRTGVQGMHWTIWHDTYFEEKWLRIFEPFIETDHTYDLDGHLLDYDYWAGIFAETRDGDFTNFWFGSHQETFDGSFDIWPGVAVPAGVHRWDDWQIEIGTARKRPADVYLRWRAGGYLNGDADTYVLGAGWRPNASLSFKTESSLHDIRLPSGSFQVRTANLKVSYTFSPDLQLSLLGQYDNISNSLGANFRLKWSPKPGNDFYFVINQGYDTTGDSIRPTQGDVSLKGKWTFRF
ncbi:MAG: DUF5916 domain-containing protein [Opitutaceae bacterium]